MQHATTLVHKGAMTIAVHAISSFSRHFRDTHSLQIHTDGSPDETDRALLLKAAAGMKATIVTPDDRKEPLAAALADYPLTAALLGQGGYFCKLELPMTVDPHHFYFDSDIVWLRPVTNLAPPNAPNAFSTESWSWYNGIANDRLWIDAKTPRRVNSGFYYLGEPFPFDRMEKLLAEGMYDWERPYNGDQEIMAYLYGAMQLYHPEDFKRSRVRVHYDLESDTSAALHFPGQMWRDHFDQIVRLSEFADPKEMQIRYQDPRPLTKTELVRMRLSIAASNSAILRHPINGVRKLRGLYGEFRAKGC